jgi:hypothetical protein
VTHLDEKRAQLDPARLELLGGDQHLRRTSRPLRPLSAIACPASAPLPPAVFCGPSYHDSRGNDMKEAPSAAGVQDYRVECENRDIRLLTLVGGEPNGSSASMHLNRSRSLL